MSAEIAAGNFGQLIRDEDVRQLRVRAIEHGDVADAVHEGARGACGERPEERVARFAVPAGRLHLDELVMGEGALGLAGHGFGEAGST